MTAQHPLPLSVADFALPPTTNPVLQSAMRQAPWAHVLARLLARGRSPSDVEFVGGGDTLSLPDDDVDGWPLDERGRRLVLVGQWREPRVGAPAHGKLVQLLVSHPGWWSWRDDGHTPSPGQSLACRYRVVGERERLVRFEHEPVPKSCAGVAIGGWTRAPLLSKSAIFSVAEELGATEHARVEALCQAEDGHAIDESSLRLNDDGSVTAMYNATMWHDLELRVIGNPLEPETVRCVVREG
jgi:hypothetical protein